MAPEPKKKFEDMSPREQRQFKEKEREEAEKAAEVKKLKEARAKALAARNQAEKEAKK